MNAIQRLDAFIQGREIDAIPVHPLLMQFAARQSGVPFGDYCRNHRDQARSMMEAARKFEARCVHPSGYPYCEARAYGLQVEYPVDNLPLAPDHLIKGPEDFGLIKPIQPEGYPFMMERVKGVALYREEMGDDLIICGHHEGIMAEYSDLRGLGEACIDLYDHPDEMHRMFTIIRENSILWGRLQLEAGAHFMSIGDAASSQIGPDLYDEFIFQHHKKLVETYHSMGGRVKLHICGDIRPILPQLIATGADIIDVDHLVEDIAPFVPLLQDHQVFCGNLDPVAVIQEGTSETILAEAERWVRATKGRGILSGGCEIPRNTPVKNLEALTMAGKELVPLWKELRRSTEV